MRAARVIQTPVQAALVVVVAILLAAVYVETLSSLIHRFSNDENYSHGFLVPFASLYLLHQRLEEPAPAGWRRRRGSMALGLGMLILAMMLLLGTTIVPSLVGECLSLLLALAGVALMAGGWLGWYYLWAPIAFLVFLIPWPSALYSQAAFPLQLLVSQSSSVILELAGIPVLRDGNVLYLPGQAMHVAQACSGLRQLTAFLAMAACAALLVRRPAWYRAALLLSAVPIAVSVNVFRVTLTSVVTYAGYGAYTEGFLHTAEGMITIVLGLGVLSLVMALLDWLVEKPASGGLP
jgi:exosortase